MSSGAEVASEASSTFWSNTSGSSSQGKLSGRRPKAQSRASSKPAPKRLAIAGARQCPDIAPGSATDALQGCHMVARGAQHLQGKFIRLCRNRFSTQSQAQLSQCRQGRAGLSPLNALQRLAIMEQLVGQTSLSTPQPQRGRCLHDQGFLDLGHAGRELQCPPAPGAALVFMRMDAVRSRTCDLPAEVSRVEGGGPLEDRPFRACSKADSLAERAGNSSVRQQRRPPALEDVQ